MARRGLAPGDIVDRVVTGLCFVLLLSFAIHKIIAWDVWWQLRSGDWILAHGFPATDPFSYGFPDRPWVELRWLWCVAVHLLATAFGLNALIVFKCALLVATFVLLARLVPAAPGWVVGVGLLAALCVMHVRFFVRPELLTFLCVMLMLFALLRYKQGGSARWIQGLPLLQVVWSNGHTLSILGPFLVGTFAVAEIVQPRLGKWLGTLARDPWPLERERRRLPLLVAAGCAAACLATPYHVRGLLFPFTLLGEIEDGSFLSRAITEFQSPWRYAGWNLPFVSYVVVTLVSAGSFVLNRRRIALSVLGCWGAFFLVSTTAQRNGALFGLVAAAATMVNLAQWARDPHPAALGRPLRLAARALSLGLVVALPPLVVTDRLWVSYHSGHAFGFGIREDHFPIRAMAFVRQQGLPVPVIAALGDGGYLLWEGGAGSVYIDGRLEVYGVETIETALRVLTTGRDLSATAERLGVRTALLRLGMEPAIAALESAADWRPVYYDASHVVYLRVDAKTREAAERLGFDWSDPPRHDPPVPAFLAPRDWLAGLVPRVPAVSALEDEGRFLIHRGNLALAEARFRRALELAPRSRTARLYQGMILEARGEDGARELLAGLENELEHEDVLALRSWIASLAGNTDRAYELKQRTAATSPRERKDLARLAIQNRAYDDAERTLLALVNEYPSDAEAWALLGDLEFIRQRLDTALGYYETTLATGAPQARIHFNIGTIRALQQRFPEARAAFEQALAIDPDYARARESLERLQSMGF